MLLIIAITRDGGIQFFFFFLIKIIHRCDFIPFGPGARHYAWTHTHTYKHTLKPKYIIEMCLLTSHILYLSYIKKVECVIQLC